MQLSEFDYHLPKESIAQHPVRERDSSRLLVLSRNNTGIRHRLFRDIVEYLHAGDVLVLNDTKVIPARVYGRRPSGGKVEILFMKEINAHAWEVMTRGLRQGKVIFENGVSGEVSRDNGTVMLTSNNEIRNLLNTIGLMPLPPYIRRSVTRSDASRYQTVYAEREGAIAAPTAGLHFTDNLLETLKGKGIEVRKLTLHVGYGTFRPVACSEIENHHMDEEHYEIPGNSADAINMAKAEGRRVIAVGTTVTRALEASACENHPHLRGRVNAGAGKTSIFMYPGYKFNVIDALVTNFHLPKSTPLLLASAFSGTEFLNKAYLEALDRGYRFFSYGDAMLII